MSCYGCSPSTGTNASTFLAAPSQACVSQQPGTHSCSEFHFRSASSSCARRPASQPAHRNTARCGLSSDAHAGATRRPQDQRFARVLLPSHLCAQAASHSTADKCRHDCCARVPANLHQQTPEPLTLCPYPNPSLFIAPARYIPKHKYKPLTVHSTVHTDSTVSP